MKQHRSTRSRTFSISSGLSEDINPQAYVANAVDCMLVLACGLMMALITFWNLDLPTVTEVQEEQELTELEDVEEFIDELENSGSLFVERGQVYEDPTTGQLYLIENGEGATGRNNRQSTTSDASDSASGGSDEAADGGDGE